jgi:adenosylmethionine-8-amino-7-oxononanoate aminotransferase
MDIDKTTIQRWDLDYLWHPFTQHTVWKASEPLVIVAGEGEFLIDADGKRYIDGISSMWCNVHGHRHPAVDAAVKEQLDKVAHTTLLGLTHPLAATLAKRLVEIAPQGLTKAFYSDDGSTAVEVAIKMAYAHWHHRGQPQRRKFLALRNAYHGDTIGAVSVGGVDVFHGVYKPLLFETLFAPSPYCYRCPLGCSQESCNLACAGEFERLLAEHADQVAAVIVEPLMQCAGGMIAAPPGYLKRVREACNRHGILLIADEIATGFGRTGRMFACEHEAVAPDLLCIGKGLTNGYLPLAATLAAERIYQAFLGGVDELKTFFHGHTFTGNPLGCAAALASLDVFESQRVLDSLPPKIQLLTDRLRQLISNRWLGDVRQRGLLAGIELVADKATKRQFPYGMQVGAQVCMAARKHGAILRPLGNTLVLFPPLCTSCENLARLLDIIEACIEEVVPAPQTSAFVDPPFSG